MMEHRDQRLLVQASNDMDINRFVRSFTDRPLLIHLPSLVFQRPRSLLNYLCGSSRASHVRRKRGTGAEGIGYCPISFKIDINSKTRQGRTGRFVVVITPFGRLLFWLSCPHLGDFVARTAQEVGSVQTLYNQDATAIKQFASDQMVVDLMKKNMSGFFGQAKQVMDALDVLQQVHPFVGGKISTCSRYCLSQDNLQLPYSLSRVSWVLN